MSSAALDRRPAAIGGFDPAAASRVRAVVDVGTSKFGCWIVRPKRSGGFELRGKGYQAADGVRSGEIVDGDNAELGIAAVVHEAEQAAGEELRAVAVVTSGGQPRSAHVRVEVPLFGRAADGADIARALDAARKQLDDPARSIIHLVPLELSIDGGRPLRDPNGMRGESLQVLAHAVSIDSRHVAQLRACLDGCHLDVVGMVSSGYASGWSVTTEEERERGVLVLDLGAGVSNVAHFFGGRLALLAAVPYGGDHITADLAHGLSTQRAHAERIKSLYTSVQARHGDADQRIAVPHVGDPESWPSGEVARSRLTEIARPRVEEILELIRNQLKDHADLFRAMPPAGLVLTGGASRIEGLVELVDEMFGLPVRFGRPDRIQAGEVFECEPCASAANGALALCRGEDGGQGWRGESAGTSLGRGWSRFRKWLRENF
ncbi:cell division protein FtsA [Geminicoccus roseus]|uniref:cell division protein FtsA n=1 Tax=Geminicoccus roseus TaxID=404900 RepID=UPI00040204C2|nr:cell division protein FtsA [Geminicoccus roseus]